MKELPLISIVVVTYNSGKFVRETLESILTQTYKGPIELFVSDDGSKDDTLKICKEWISKHHSFFTKAQVIQTPNNLGICGNYNFALSHLRGEWVKYIAGDDLLMPECIYEFVKTTQTSKDKFFISGVYCFESESKKLVPRFLMENHLDSHEANVQANNLAKYAGGGIVEGPSFFINVEFLREMGGMDTKYPMLEDFPFAFRCAYQGHHIGVIKKPLVKYRLYPESVSQAKEMFKVMYHEALYDARMKIANQKHNYFEWWHHWIMKKLSGYSSIKKFNKWMSYVLKFSDVYAFSHSFKLNKIFYLFKKG